MTERYLKQVIVARKDLCMPSGKLAAMVAHASMTFLLSRIRTTTDAPRHPGRYSFELSDDQVRWLRELDPGLESIGQVSMAKIVLAVKDEPHLLEIEKQAQDACLEIHRVVDSGYSHNKAGALACIAIGPDWPEKLDPVTGGLKVYR